MHLLPAIIFTLSGGDPASFLTAARNAGIPIRHFRKTGTSFSGELPAGKYRKAARLGRKNGVRLRISKKSGVFFQFYRRRKRLGFLIGFAACIAALLFSQNFLWAVDVAPTGQVTEQQVLDVLRRHGIRTGTYLPAADLKNTARLARTELPGLSFLALNRIGSRIQVEMAEAVAEPERPPVSAKGTCNIVAARNGIIRTLEAYRGQTMVRVNQAVQKGELLVSGVVENADGRTSYQHAAARVIAETQREECFSIPLSQSITEETGETAVRYRLDLFGKKLPLFAAFPPFQPKRPYESRFSLSELKIGPLRIPVGIEREELHFLQKREQRLSEEEALGLLRNMASIREKELGGQILRREPEAVVRSGKMILTVKYTLLEDIALEKAFSCSELPPP